MFCTEFEFAKYCREGNNDQAIKHLNNNDLMLTDDKTLYYACKNNMEQVAIEIINRSNGNYHYKDKDFNTPMLMACFNNMKQVISLIMDKDKTCLQDINLKHQTPLLIMCMKGNEQLALKMLDNVARGKLLPNYSPWSSLSWSCENNLDQVALRLLSIREETVASAKEKMSTNDFIKLTASIEAEISLALYHACKNDMLDVIKEMIKIYPKIPNNIVLFLLFMTCEQKKHDIALLLIENCTILGHTNKNNETPLIVACKNSMDDIAIKIINTGIANPLHVDDNMSDALIHASKNKMEKTIKALKEIKEVGYADYLARIT